MAVVLGDLLKEVLDEVVSEVRSACQEHDEFNSAHEGYSVILEELDELWAEVKKMREVRSRETMRAEAIQVAAMAVRFVHDVCAIEETIR